MVYVTSDLHGCPLAAFQNLLKQADFSEADYLFVLGDVIDRGSDGAELLRLMAEQPNVSLILGNHEAMLLSCDFLFQAVTEKNLDALNQNHMALLNTWMTNGAAPTLAGLRKILKSEPDVLEGILDYLRDAPLYDIVEAGGRTYILAHAGLENFRPDRPLDDYDPDELLWARPTLQTRFFDDAVVVFGHTPTEYFGEAYRGKPLHTDTWICIDTGTHPTLLRLDDLKTFQ